MPRALMLVLVMFVPSLTNGQNSSGTGLDDPLNRATAGQPNDRESVSGGLLEPFLVLEADLFGQDVGVPIYNDRLKRFKFRLEKIKVVSAAETAEMFWAYYRDRGNPWIKGVWGDPQTNSIVVVGPPEADQPIRETIAEWEGAQLGIDLTEDDSLESQHRQLRRRHRYILARVTRLRLEMIDVAASSDNRGGDRLQELERQHLVETTELETTEQKIDIINNGLKRLKRYAHPRR